MAKLGGRSIRVYWANAFFSEADRAFNQTWVSALRHQGFQVFLPQEANLNRPSTKGPAALGIYRQDTAMLLDCDVLVACLDQESIDAGVACEIGVAIAAGVPVIGLYTDVRRTRVGLGRMYKNLYVVGAIEASGQLVHNLGSLLAALRRVGALDVRRVQPRGLKAVYDQAAPRYDRFVVQLERWYVPRWSLAVWFEPILRTYEPRRFFELGCGTGRAADVIARVRPSCSYIGYDSSGAMVEAANASRRARLRRFTTSWATAQSEARRAPFDMALMAFTLHDQADPTSVVKRVRALLRPGGVLLVADLTRDDLPRLTTLVRTALVAPLRAPDPRLDAQTITSFGGPNLRLLSARLALPRVHFPGPQSIDRYLSTFGVYSGFDMPIRVPGLDRAAVRRRVRAALAKQTYPFVDQRSFVLCEFGAKR
jgi:nucleoside 2-deoxyribosyltransferase/SAM-dependent methyltransferase